MRPLIHEVQTQPAPESVAGRIGSEAGLVLLRTALFGTPHARYSFVAAHPFLTFRSFGSRCETRVGEWRLVQFGDPWRILEGLLSRYELLDEIDLPFPLGGCFGYWGYDLKNFVEPKLPRRAVNDLDLPDCHVGFYDSLVVFDHRLTKTWIVSTGLRPDGSRDADQARRQFDLWLERLRERLDAPDLRFTSYVSRPPALVNSTHNRPSFLAGVKTAQRYIRSGDIYQANLSQRLSAPWDAPGWEMYRRLLAVSPAPFSAYLDCGEFQIASSSPELFLRFSGGHVLTRPIKGTRKRSTDPRRDAQLSEELRASAKDRAELVMITDLLRNDLGKICEFGSVQVPDLVCLERYPQVQHLVSTIEGQLRPEVTHLAALAAGFPGGSITGAPKFRAMEIIDELEPVTRGPYTGALGYLGFNRESELSILIRAAICGGGCAHFNVGAGIVADSVPEAEYEETLAKAGGFLAALNWQPQGASVPAFERCG
ncbi:MAG: anthranilate synthase component I family protein [Verrucomicrobia bacterium]|nr:anthranilate synthase component I family protein [Verrucomicrobiota bacterium]